MDDDKQTELNKRIRVLHDKYCSQLPDKYQEIEDYWLAYQSDPGNSEHINTFYRLIHTLKGTAATFGFTSQSDICFEIQQCLIQAKEKHVALNTDEIKKIQSHINELKINILEPAKHFPGQPD